MSTSKEEAQGGGRPGGDIIKVRMKRKYESKMFRNLLGRLMAMSGVRRWEIASDKMKAARDIWIAGQTYAANRTH